MDYHLDYRGYMVKYAHKDKNRKFQHRLVYEEYYKCCLLDWTIVHHKNHDRTDNNIDNLIAMMRGKHQNIHNPKLGFRKDENRSCIRCNSTTTYRNRIGRDGKPVWAWYSYGDGYLCGTCWHGDLHKRKKRP